MSEVTLNFLARDCRERTSYNTARKLMNHFQEYASAHGMTAGTPANHPDYTSLAVSFPSGNDTELEHRLNIIFSDLATVKFNRDNRSVDICARI